MPDRYTILRVFIACGLLGWLLRSGRLDLSILLLSSFNFLHVLGILALLGAMLVQALRWWWLLRAQNINLSFPRALRLSWVAQFFTIVLPGAAGGELARGYYIAKEAREAKLAGISTVLLDRMIGLYAMLWLGVVSFILLGLQGALSPPVLQLGVLILLLALGASSVFLIFWLYPDRRGPIRFLPERFRASVVPMVHAYRSHGRDLVVCFALSLLACVMVMVAFLTASVIVDTPLSWKEVLLVTPLVFVAGALPISPGGIGVAETASSILLLRFGVETGAAIMLMIRVWALILRLPGGLLYLFGIARSPVKQPVKEPNP